MDSICEKDRVAIKVCHLSYFFRSFFKKEMVN